jgi:hypothetical protein
MYQESRYNFGEGRGTSNKLLSKEILIVTDILYLIGVVWMAIQVFKIVKNVIIELYRYRKFSLEWTQIFDILIFALTLTSLSYWIKNFLIDDVLKMPPENDKEFQDMVNMANTVTKIRSISAILFILLSFRTLRILTTQFPSFGALFDTINIAKKDLGNIFVILCIISIGFIFISMLLLGPYLTTFRQFSSASYVIFQSLMGEEESSTFESTLLSVILSNTLFIVIMVTLNLILLQVTITIVITRYKYLREKVQLENEAYARIIGQDSLVNFNIFNLL